VLLRQATFRWIKLVGIAFSIGGVVLIALNDRDSTMNERFDGDLLCLFSAVAYACCKTDCCRSRCASTQTVSSDANFLQRGIKDERRVSMAMFFGFVGAWNLLLIWPCFFLLDVSGLEVFSWPAPETAGYLVLNGLIGTVLSDWVRVR
jgi:solute carrier family 35 protein F5